MFNYLFPIFCFGLVITGIVLLGIMEAAKQAKAQLSMERDRETRAEQPALSVSRNGHETRVNVSRIHE